MLNLINEQKDIHKICLYAKDLSEPKYEYLIKNRKNTGIKHLNDGNAFIEYSSKNILESIIKELFIRCRKLDISLLFIKMSYFSVPKDVRLNSTRYFIMKINNKRKLQNIATNHSADIDYKDSIKIYK